MDDDSRESDLVNQAGRTSWAWATGHRLRQGVRALWPRPSLDQADLPSGLLTGEQTGAFLALPRADQDHLLRVYERLRAESVSNRDVLIAALLHDIGKSTEAGRVRLIDRVALVLLPSVAVRFATLPAPVWRRGLAIAVHHAAIGADLAATLGCSERTCWLIRHHHDNAPTDPDLRQLQAADRVD